MPPMSRGACRPPGRPFFQPPGYAMGLSSDECQQLQREHAALLAAYGRVQSHCSRLLSAQAGRIERLESETCNCAPA